MPTMEAVLGGGPQATPNFHDFMVGKNLRYITDDGELENVIKELEGLTSVSTKEEPQLLCVDVETTAVKQLLKTYESKFDEHQKIQAAFTAFPVPNKCTPEQRKERAEAKTKLALARSDINDVAKRVKRAGLNVHVGQVRLLQIYWGSSDVVVIDRWQVSHDKFLDVGGRVLNKNNVVWLAHNTQFDVKMLAQYGISPSKHPHCTLLQAQALESVMQSRKDLATRCSVILKKEPNKTQQASDWGRVKLSSEQLYYAGGDVVATWELHEKQIALVDNMKRLPMEECRWVYDLMRSSIKAVNEVMLTGINFDTNAHKALADKLAKANEDGLATCIELFKKHSASGSPEVENPASNRQVAEWVKHHLMLYAPFTTDNWPKTDTGQLKVGKEHILENIGQVHPDHKSPLMALANWAEAKKNNSTLGSDFTRFVNPISKRIHANFRIGGTETGRFSVTEPALQTINASKEFRHLFTAKDGHSLVVCDYGQIEVRVPASIANDRQLIDAIENGLDIHTMTAKHCFRGDYPADTPDTAFKDDGDEIGEFSWMRQASKACIFGLIYGQGPRGLAQRLTSSGHPTTPHEAGRIQHDVLDLYSGLKEWIVKTRKQADDSGYLWTPQGRVYAPYYVEQLYTKSVNTPCQGGASEIMLLCLSKFPKIWGSLNAKLVHVVHDELIAEVPDNEADKAKQIMVDTMQWAALSLFPNIPKRKLVEGGIGKTWGLAK